MAKYYVESGSFAGIVDSYDFETAAVWAVHRVMDVPKPLRSAQPSGGAEIADDAQIGLFRLADEVRVSERGFGRRDAVCIPTSHAFLRWVQLRHAAEALQDKMNEAF